MHAFIRGAIMECGNIPIRKFKGLESDIIIMVDVDDTSLADDEGKMLFYVGGSRAKHQLEILFIGDDVMLNKTIKKI